MGDRPRWLWVHTVAVLSFLLVPLLMIFPISFGDSRFLSFPPEEYSTRWYEEFLGSSAWLDSLSQSLVVGALAAVVATVVGTPAAMALVRGRFRGKALLRLVIMAPLVVPVIVLAIGLYDIYARLQLIGTTVGLALAHAMLALPFVVLVMSGSFQNFDERLEQAAWTLGASKATTLRRVTLPAIAPGLVASLLLAFVISFDEIVIAIFLAGVGNQTLPVRIFTFMTTEISPLIAAVSVLLVTALLLVIFVAQLRRLTAKRSTKERKGEAATAFITPV